MTSPLRPSDSVAFARLSQDLLAEPDTEHTVQRVVELAQRFVPGCHYAGFTSTHPDRLETMAATHEVVSRLDRTQHDLHEGPCLDAARADETHLIRSTTDEKRWPRWCAEATANGVLSVLSIHLTSPTNLHAALNLYSKSVDAFDEDAIVTAQVYAAHAGNAIGAKSQAEQLTTAMQSRHQIGVAQGMLMVRYGLTEPQAFQFLSRNSQDTNTKLRDLARRVIDELSQHRWPAGD
jgi:transcriptional regulator with GAF, ATPase, and Fis domain